MELYRGLAETAIRHVTPRHEQGAVFMADGYARSSGRPGVACIITGPGLQTELQRSPRQSGLHSSARPDHPDSWRPRRQGPPNSHELLNQASLVAGLTSNYSQPQDAQAVDRAIGLHSPAS